MALRVAALLVTFCALLAGCSSSAVDLATLPPDRSLQLRPPAGSDIRFGTAVSMDPRALANPRYTSVLTENFNSITPENQMKWGVLEKTRGQVDYSSADRLVRFARKNQMAIRGHTLLWHNNLPAWVLSLPRECSILRPVLRAHVDQLVSRYRDAVDEWDVANEIYMDDGSLRTEQNPFLDACGEGIIADVFRWARAADPSATLYLNDYDVLSNGPRERSYLRLVERLKRAQVPVGGFGVQAHVELGDRGIRDLPQVLRKFGRLGLQTAVTEADVQLDTPAPQKVKSGDLAAQASAYRRLLAACLSEPTCRNFTVWGFTDRFSWVPGAIPGRGAATLFTHEFRPKPAARALQRELASDR